MKRGGGVDVLREKYLSTKLGECDQKEAGSRGSRAFDA
jgi:hypothetical protein